jgi:hypothetical protein
MRTQIEIFDPYGRDVSWISQEACERYAVACYRGYGDDEIAAICQHDKMRMFQWRELFKGNPDIEALAEEIVAELGGDEIVLGKPKTTYAMRRILEDAIVSEKDPKAKAAYLKLWYEQHGERAPPIAGAAKADDMPESLTSNDPNEAIRIFLSVIAK